MALINGTKDSKLWLFHADPVMLDFKLDPIIAYLEESEAMIRRKGDEIKTKFHAWEKMHGDNLDVPNAYDIYESEILNYAEFPKLLNNSIFLVLYSMFESHFEELCAIVGNKVGSSLRVKDLAVGRYIELCRYYLIKVVGVDLELLNPEWTEIKKYQTLRNAIAHKAGRLKKPTCDLERFIEQKAGVRLSNQTILIEDIFFLKSFIELIKAYFAKTNAIIANHVYNDY